MQHRELEADRGGGRPPGALDPLRMAYMDVRPLEPNEQAVVLLHGKNFNGDYWGRTAATLAEEGYRVVVPDQIGFGKSSKPAASYERFVEPLLGLLADELTEAIETEAEVR